MTTSNKSTLGSVSTPVYGARRYENTQSVSGIILEKAIIRYVFNQYPGQDKNQVTKMIMLDDIDRYGLLNLDTTNLSAVDCLQIYYDRANICGDVLPPDLADRLLPHNVIELRDQIVNYYFDQFWQQKLQGGGSNMSAYRHDLMTLVKDYREYPTAWPARYLNSVVNRSFVGMATVLPVFYHQDILVDSVNSKSNPDCEFWGLEPWLGGKYSIPSHQQLPFADVCLTFLDKMVTYDRLDTHNGAKNTRYFFHDDEKHLWVITMQEDRTCKITNGLGETLMRMLLDNDAPIVVSGQAILRKEHNPNREAPYFQVTDIGSMRSAK